MISFNTASGKCYCNTKYITDYLICLMSVSIPQAVSAIAIGNSNSGSYHSCRVSIPQAVSAIAIKLFKSVRDVASF